MNSIYYKEMRNRGRLLPFYRDGKLVAILTFFLGAEDKRKDMWELPVEDHYSDTITLDHFISKDKDNKYYILAEWHNVKRYLKQNFPQSQWIQWYRLGKPRKTKLGGEIPCLTR